MPDEACDRTIASREDQSQNVSDPVEKQKIARVILVAQPATRRASKSPQVRREHMEPRRRQYRHGLSPTVCQLGKPVEEHDERPSFGPKTGLQYVHFEPVRADETRTDAGRQNGR